MEILLIKVEGTSIGIQLNLDSPNLSVRIHDQIRRAYVKAPTHQEYLVVQDPRLINLTFAEISSNHEISQIINALATPLKNIQWEKIANPERRFAKFNITRLVCTAAELVK